MRLWSPSTLIRLWLRPYLAVEWDGSHAIKPAFSLRALQTEMMQC